MRWDDSRVQDGRLVPCNDHQPRLWTRVGRLSRLLVLRDDPAVPLPGAGRPGRHGRQSDARSHRSHGRVVRRQSDRNLRRLGDVRSLRRAERRRPSTVRRRLRLVCRLRCANRRSSVLRRKRSAATKHRTDQGSTTLSSCQFLARRVDLYVAIPYYGPPRHAFLCTIVSPISLLIAIESGNKILRSRKAHVYCYGISLYSGDTWRKAATFSFCVSMRGRYVDHTSRRTLVISVSANERYQNSLPIVTQRRQTGIASNFSVFRPLCSRRTARTVGRNVAGACEWWVSHVGITGLPHPSRRIVKVVLSYRYDLCWYHY